MYNIGYKLDKNQGTLLRSYLYFVLQFTYKEEKYLKMPVIPVQAGIHLIPGASRRDASAVSLPHGFTHGQQRNDRPQTCPARRASQGENCLNHDLQDYRIEG